MQSISFRQERSTERSVSDRSISSDKSQASLLPSANTKQQCISPSSQICVLGLLLGVLCGGLALGTILALWLTTTSTTSTSSTVSSTLTSTASTVGISTIPMTAPTTTICSISAVSSTTAAPATTTIFTMMNPCAAISTYFSIVYYYIARGSNQTITFAIQNNPGSTQIDDVSVKSNGIELLCNGGFENGTQTCWQGSNHLTSGCGNTGSYCYSDPVVGSLDYVSQSFQATPGALLNISFWTRWYGSGNGVSTIVTITP